MSVTCWPPERLARHRSEGDKQCRELKGVVPYIVLWESQAVMTPPVQSISLTITSCADAAFASAQEVIVRLVLCTGGVMTAWLSQSTKYGTA